MFGRNAARAHIILGAVASFFGALNLALGLIEWRHSNR